MNGEKLRATTYRPFGDPLASDKGRRKSFLRDWQFWLGLAVSLFFLYWAFRQAGDLGKVGGAIAAANYIYMLPALVAYFIGVGLRAIRWHLLLRPLKSIGSRRLFPIVVIGYMANDVMPARMGELVRAYVLSRDEGVSKTAGLATIFVERVVDGITMLLFVAVVSLLVPLGTGLQQIASFAAVALFSLALAAVVAARSPEGSRRLIGLVTLFAPKRASHKIEVALERFVGGMAILQNGRLMVGVLALSAVVWLFEAAMYYLVGLGFGLGLGFTPFVLTTAIANLGTMVPSSPGYVGTFEALATFSLSRFSVSADTALSYVVALHAALLIPVTLLGFYYMWRRHISIRQAS